MFLCINELQVLDLVGENEHVGYWSLLLSQLPIVYGHLTKEHLETVAEEMVKAVLTEGGDEDNVIADGGSQGAAGMSVVQVISAFLGSEGFVEMNILQELILSRLCTHLSSLMRRR